MTLGEINTQSFNVPDVIYYSSLLASHSHVTKKKTLQFKRGYKWILFKSYLQGDKSELQFSQSLQSIPHYQILSSVPGCRANSKIQKN